MEGKLPRDIRGLVDTKLQATYKSHIRSGIVAAANVDHVKFPEPTGIEVNMLPFDLFDTVRTLPRYLHGYRGMIDTCRSRIRYRKGTCIAFLTIHESEVKAGETQRRPGIHIESPVVNLGNSHDRRYVNLSWGEGAFLSSIHEGIFMANNVDNSCEVWNMKVKDSSKLIQSPSQPLDFLAPAMDEVIQAWESPFIYGVADHVVQGTRPYRQKLKANELWWITDETPHCSLPVEDDCQRSFFRLVVGPVGIRWTEDCTPNNLVDLPEDMIIVEGSKCDWGQL